MATDGNSAVLSLLSPLAVPLLLKPQDRARVLNGQLAGDFHRWYPGVTRASDPTRPRGVASPDLSRSRDQPAKRRRG